MRFTPSTSLSPTALVTFALLAVGSAAAGFAIAAPSQEQRVAAPPPPDTRDGGGPRSVEAVSQKSLVGGTTGVLVYRNGDGAKCFAIGTPKGNTVVSPRDAAREVPLSLAGSCVTDSRDVTYRVDQTPEGVMVYGLASDEVAGVELAIGGESARVQKSSDGGFIVTILQKELSGRPLLRVSKIDGTTELIEAPELVDIDAQNREIRRQIENGLFDQAK